jgi:hypothetical protein
MNKIVESRAFPSVHQVRSLWNFDNGITNKTDYLRILECPKGRAIPVTGRGGL